MEVPRTNARRPFRADPLRRNWTSAAPGPSVKAFTIALLAEKAFDSDFALSFFLLAILPSLLSRPADACMDRTLKGSPPSRRLIFAFSLHFRLSLTSMRPFGSRRQTWRMPVHLLDVQGARIHRLSGCREQRSEERR